MSRQDLLEPDHDLGVASHGRASSGRVVGGQALDQRVDHFLLQGPADLGVSDDMRRRLCKARGLGVQPQETCHGGSGRSQDLPEWRRGDIHPGQGPTIGGELFGCERDGPPMAFADHALMKAFAPAMEHELPTPEFDPTRDDCRAPRRWEGDESQLRRQRGKSDTRQLLLATQQMQLAHLRVREAGPEMALAGDDKIDSRRT